MVRDGVYRVFLADATGHGVAASLITILIKCEYEKLKIQESSPSEILKKLSLSFYNISRTLNLYFTSIIADIDIINNRLIFSSTGHPSQYLISEKKVTQLTHAGMAIGLSRTINLYDREYLFTKGMKLIFFTDGVFEQFNAESELYGEERFMESVKNASEKNISDLINTAVSDLKSYINGEEYNDDITIIGIEWPLPKSSSKI